MTPNVGVKRQRVYAVSGLSDQLDEAATRSNPQQLPDELF